MRIFCPAMVVGRPSLPAARYACPGGTRTGSPRRRSAGRTCWSSTGAVSPPAGVRSTRSGVSPPGRQATRRPVPGSPASPRGVPAVRGADVGPAHTNAEELICTRARRSPTSNPSRMPHGRATPPTGGCGGPEVTRGPRRLLVDLGDLAGADGPATLADGELQALLHGDRLDQRDAHRGVVARHDHLGPAGQGHHARHVRGAEVELRAVVVEERRVPAALVLGQDVDLALELGVRGDRAGLADDLPALDVLALDAAQQQADVLAGAPLVEDLAEHLDARDGRRGVLLADADDLDGLADLDDAALDATGHDGAAAGDREDVLDGHEERLLDVTLGLRDRLVDGVHQAEELLAPLRVALERLERRDLDDRQVVARVVLSRQQLADLQLDELEDLLVVDHVGLVQRHHDVGHADLAGEQHVLTRLRHGAVGGGDHQDRAVHLGGTGDHVLDVVGVPGAVDVRVVPLLGLVLDVRDRDRDAALTLLGSLVDLVERRSLVEVRVLVVQDLRDGRRQRGLTVVDVTDGADVDVRLGPLELRLRHWGILLD